MDWIDATFSKYAELAVFLVVGVGYWIVASRSAASAWGRSRIAPGGPAVRVDVQRSGVVDGQVDSVPAVLFAIGYSVGPNSFRR
jgi:hypothetical protein